MDGVAERQSRIRARWVEVLNRAKEAQKICPNPVAALMTLFDAHPCDDPDDDPDDDYNGEGVA